MTKLSGFVRGLPEFWATCPIYAKGVELPPDRNGKVRTSDGKVPHVRWKKDHITPSHAAQIIESAPDSFKAIGVRTGPVSRGLVILDVDKRLGALKRGWTDLEGAPFVESGRRNAGKYLFYVPEKMWDEVSDLSHTATENLGYEVLWGRQGIIFGAYAHGGDYKFQGDLNSIPQAPAWLLAEMKEGFRRKEASKKTATDLLDRRSREEKIDFVKVCLSAIPPQGGEDHWVKIGMMIHSGLPDETGLDLWREWSKKDTDYSQDWENGDPCEERWSAGFKAGGGLTFGTLLYLAKEEDPRGNRFKSEEGKRVKEWVMRIHGEADYEKDRYVTPQQTFTTIREAVQDVYEIDNPAEQMVEMHFLAIKTGWKVDRLEEMYVADQEYRAAEHQGEITLADLMKMKLDRKYLIPGVLPSPFTVLIYGAGGDGKSSAAWTVAKHVATGDPFKVKGQGESVNKGPVLILNGDQPMIQMQDQLAEIDIPEDAMRNVVIRNGFDLTQQGRFIDLMKKYKPSLVIIDSLVGCSGARAADENKSIYARPLYWLTRNNGVTYPATTVMIIHHSNKQGGFRGTTAIRDAVDEVWALRKLSDEEQKLEIEAGNEDPTRTRVVTVEKSRQGREQSHLWLHKNQDETFTLEERAKPLASDTRPMSKKDRALEFLRKQRGKGFTLQEINKSVHSGLLRKEFEPGVRTAINRLLKEGLIEKAGVSGKSHLYRALLAETTSLLRGDPLNLETVEVVPLQEKGSEVFQPSVSPCVSNPDETLAEAVITSSQPSQPLEPPTVSPLLDTLRETGAETLKDPSDTNGSDPSVSKVPRIPARMQRGPGMWNAG
tara:strand:- start:4150 stop:6633 length:2484 start_codon:yes stop_codon:yes gene_type:complete